MLLCEARFFCVANKKGQPLAPYDDDLEARAALLTDGGVCNVLCVKGAAVLSTNITRTRVFKSLTTDSALHEAEMHAMVSAALPEHCVPLLGVYEPHGTHARLILVMRYAHVIDYGSLPLARRVEIVAQLLEGLVALHDAHVLHGDIKPANTMMLDGAARWIDWQFASIVLAAPHELASTFLWDYERQGGGSDGYLAPECRGAVRRTLAVDIYAFGVMLGTVLHDWCHVSTVAADATHPSPVARPTARVLLDRLRRCKAADDDAAAAAAAAAASRQPPLPPRRSTNRARPPPAPAQRRPPQSTSFQNLVCWIEVTLLHVHSERKENVC